MRERERREKETEQGREGERDISKFMFKFTPETWLSSRV